MDKLVIKMEIPKLVKDVAITIVAVLIALWIYNSFLSGTKKEEESK